MIEVTLSPARHPRNAKDAGMLMTQIAQVFG